MRIPGNADSHAGGDLRGRPRYPTQPQRPVRAQIEPVVAAIDVHRDGEPAWPTREIPQAIRAAPDLHERNALERLERSDQNPGPDSAGFARDIEQVPHAVIEVYVGMSALEKQRAIACRRSAEGMAGCIADHIGLGFDDSSARRSRARLVHQHAADEETRQLDAVDRQLCAAQASDAVRGYGRRTGSARAPSSPGLTPRDATTPSRAPAACTW